MFSGGTGTTSVTFSSAFKRVYNSGSQVMITQQNLEAPIWKRIKTSPLKPSAQGVWNAVTMTGNEVVQSIPQEGSFDIPESINPQSPTIYPQLIVSPLTITGSAIKLSESNVQAFVSALDAQVKDNAARVYANLNRMCQGKGNGQITLANGAGVASTSLVVDNVLTFRTGMFIDAYASLGGVKEIAGVKITAVNFDTNTLTLASAQSWSDNAVITMKNAVIGTTCYEIMGLQGICDTTAYSTTFEGLPVSANSEWVGNVVSANNAPISQDLLQRTAYRARVIGGGNPNLLISNYGQPRNFLNTELQKVRYEAAIVKGGHTVLKWNDMEWVMNKDYDIGEVGMYDTRFVEKFTNDDVGLADFSGSTFTAVSGTDKISGYFRFQGNVGTWKRNVHARLTNLVEPQF